MGKKNRKRTINPPKPTGVKKKAHRNPVAYKAKIGAPPPVTIFDVEGPPPVSTPQTQELLTLATANTAAEDLETLYDCLSNKQPDYTVLSQKCALGAVCWNWVFYGGSDAFAEDPSWAYTYVKPTIGSSTNKLLTSNVTDLLNQAKAQIKNFSMGRLPESNEETAHKLILRAILEYLGIAVQDDSPLKVLLYYRKKHGIMYHHVEFEYRDAITITKGNNEILKAFNGESGLTIGAEVFEEVFGKIGLGINIGTLKPPHFVCIKDLRAQAEDMAMS